MYMDDEYQEPNSRSIASRLNALAMVVVCILITFPGCNGSRSKGPQGTVYGKVTGDTGPIPPGTIVTYISDAGGTASGVVDAGGNYRLMSMYGDGVPVGKYKVVVMAASVESSATPEQQMEESMLAMQSGKVYAPAENSLIPTKYGNFATTPESREVKEGENEIDINLAK
jgi:hypothetical protein